MAFDGLTVAAITAQLDQKCTGGRIYKIAQPEKDALLITIKTASGGQERLFMSADASLPLVYLTKENRPSPMTAPTFCMLLRKHLQNGVIVSISQPDFERIIRITVEHYNEMGDLKRVTLLIEIMGKYSNIILIDEDNKILDSIKRVSGLVSSVREVLPGKDYFVPGAGEKANPLLTTKEEFSALIFDSETSGGLSKLLPKKFTGISSVSACMILAEAGIPADKDLSLLSMAEKESVLVAFKNTFIKVGSSHFSPAMYYAGGMIAEYSCLPLQGYERDEKYESMSELIETFYARKERITRIRQRSADLRQIVSTALERAVRKLQLQTKQMKDTENRDMYRVYGELLNTYGYQIRPGDKFLEVENYYDGKMVKIPLDETKTFSENSKKFFEKYNKQKRTFEALTEFIEQSAREVEHLKSVLAALDTAEGEGDLAQIRLELQDTGYIKKRAGEKKVKVTSKPLHFLSSDGFHIYVGKNNYQNEELTFKVASGGDWWFHVKKMPGSHVILKTEGKEVPDRAFEEAGALAAYYSSGADQGKVEIDYVKRKEIKKPAGGAPGFVVYYTNYSLIAIPNIGMLEKIND
ncbi:MAG: NFACT family protein [Lachnospiraceae bacterium]|nr:NFACT family protein [Lachnospiraceae bacterium]